jgi:hypothetical protein
MATTYNITAIRGDTKALSINVPDINITGYTFRLTIKNIDDVAGDDTTAIVAKYWTSHVDTHNTVVSLLPAETAFVEGTYKYDIQMSSPAGVVNTLIIGDYEQINDVTKTTP